MNFDIVTITSKRRKKHTTTFTRITKEEKLVIDLEQVRRFIQSKDDFLRHSGIELLNEIIRSLSVKTKKRSIECVSIGTRGEGE